MPSMPLCWRKQGERMLLNCVVSPQRARKSPNEGALTRDQDALVQMQTRLGNQLTACLKAFYPVALDRFAKLQHISTLAFLQTSPILQAAQAATVEQMTGALKQAGHPSAPNVALKIFERLHQPQLVANAVTTRTRIALDAGVDRSVAAFG